MPPLIKRPINITIVDDSRSEKCNVHCGADWSSAETIALANQRIKDKFSNKIKLEYLDLANPMTNPQSSELRQRIDKDNLTLPILVVNGQLRISGQFDIRLLLDAIDAEVEIKP